VLGLILAVLLFFLVDVSIRQRAAQAREEVSRHVAVYLDLIALELAASRGPTEALHRGAAVGGGWVSRRIRETLDNSRLRLEPPWRGLTQVADEINVPALGDVGDTMTLVGDEGAQVYSFLGFPGRCSGRLVGRAKLEKSRVSLIYVAGLACAG
jgi:hypothetical protein